MATGDRPMFQSRWSPRAYSFPLRREQLFVDGLDIASHLDSACRRSRAASLGLVRDVHHEPGQALLAFERGLADVMRSRVRSQLLAHLVRRQPLDVSRCAVARAHDTRPARRELVPPRRSRERLALRQRKVEAGVVDHVRATCCARMSSASAYSSSVSPSMSSGMAAAIHSRVA